MHNSVNRTLTKAATDHSGFQAMTNTMSHAGFGGSNFIDRIRSIGGDRFKDPTENVAMGQRSAEAVYNIWRNSPSKYSFIEALSSNIIIH
jgi:uncharacterized protein YkwD